LPERPHLEHYKKLAKKMAKAEPCKLTQAQFKIARQYGFESWLKFARHVGEVSRSSSTSRFEAAADSIVLGNIDRLKELLQADPGLIHARSTRQHAATLLHYTAANGVENFRQKTPPNIVEIADFLLNKGAHAEAVAKVYDGSTTLALAATSGHPEKAGVQEALLETLLDHGARMTPRIVFACLSNGRGKAAEFLANHGAPLNLAEAAGVGRLEEVKKLLPEAGREAGFLFASQYGHNAVVEFFLDQGVDIRTSNKDGQTALHWAVIGGRAETVTLLLRHNAPLEAENQYGGTALGQALWSAAHDGDPEVYLKILNLLASAGARIPERHPPMNARVDAWLAARGSRVEQGWRW